MIRLHKKCLLVVLITRFWIACHCIPKRRYGQCPLIIPHKLSTRSALVNDRRPAFITIAHRGASFSLPEHTIAGYRLALELGADYIEPDLISTKDGRLIAMHYLDMNITTNVQDIYPDRHGDIVTENGKLQKGYFAFNFTLEEIKVLRVKQRLSDSRSRHYDGLFSIPTLHDILDLLHEWNHNIRINQNIDRMAGIYPELKLPDIHSKQNISLVDAFIEELQTHPFSDEMFFKRSSTSEFGCERPGSYQVPPLVVQCFKADVLSDLEKKLIERSMSSPPYILLVSKNTCKDPMFWSNIDKLPILSGLGPDKSCLDGDEGATFIKKAHELGLAVHPYTSRAEAKFFDASTYITARAEVESLYCKTGIDGMFIENVDVGVEVGIRGCDSYDTMHVEKRTFSSSRDIIIVLCFIGMGVVAFKRRKSEIRFSRQRLKWRRGFEKKEEVIPIWNHLFQDNDKKI
jgi:glycerophosphoryl diester phosphodiesterase